MTLPDPTTMPLTRLRSVPSYFHIMAKPTGVICNLDCEYCFFLSKEALYPDSPFRMKKDVLEAYIKQAIESQSQNAPQVTIAWQGGARRNKSSLLGESKKCLESFASILYQPLKAHPG